MAEWFRKRLLEAGLTLVEEPAVHPIFRANVFYLEGRDLDLVVDTGMGIGDLAAALPGRPGKPLLAVATHGHVDHVGSLHQFADRAGPAVEAEAFATMDDRFTYADMFRALKEPVTRLPHEGWSAKAWRLTPAPLTRLLGEGDVVDTGDRRLTVLSLPGHSPGSIGLFDERAGLLFSGDAIYDDELYDALPDSDRAAYRTTMARLAELPVRRVLGGHGPPMDEDRMHAIARCYLARGAG